MPEDCPEGCGGPSGLPVNRGGAFHSKPLRAQGGHHKLYSADGKKEPVRRPEGGARCARGQPAVGV